MFKLSLNRVKQDNATSEIRHYSARAEFSHPRCFSEATLTHRGFNAKKPEMHLFGPHGRGRVKMEPLLVVEVLHYGCATAAKERAGTKTRRPQRPLRRASYEVQKPVLPKTWCQCGRSGVSCYRWRHCVLCSFPRLADPIIKF